MNIGSLKIRTAHDLLQPPLKGYPFELPAHFHPDRLAALNEACRDEHPYIFRRCHFSLIQESYRRVINKLADDYHWYNTDISLVLKRDDSTISYARMQQSFPFSYAERLAQIHAILLAHNLPLDAPARHNRNPRRRAAGLALYNLSLSTTEVSVILGYRSHSAIMAYLNQTTQSGG